MTYEIFIPDKISRTSIKMFNDAGFAAEYNSNADINECNQVATRSDALVIRSYDLHKLETNKRIKAIGRSGAGVNNIPVEKMTEEGIVVFNTPGANANAVKELVLCGLFLSSRKIVDGINWTKEQKEFNDEIPKIIEKGKNQFKGNEILGKNLGVIGLGAIGMLVANDGIALGMHVIGHDPYITIENAWKLSANVKKAKDVDSLLKNSDYLTIHIPFSKETKGSINKHYFEKMKKGIKIMNFSRDEIVDTDDLIEALKTGIVESYVTDFPNYKLLKIPGVICIPHLGASTDEAEENCAIMITNQLIDFLKDGTITNSVNFPNCTLERKGKNRITIINRNIPNIIEKITNILADSRLNIEEMINKSRGEYAYNIIDVNGEINNTAINSLSSIEGVIKVRLL